MKKGVVLSFIIVSLLISIVSAEIIINEQPKEVYSLGDTISIPLKIESPTTAIARFQMNLICGGVEKNVYNQGPINLLAGEEKSIDFSIPFVKDIIGDSKGFCKIECTLKNMSRTTALSDDILTNEFKLSDFIEVKSSINKNKLDPAEELSITGNATKESKSEMNGIVEIIFFKEGSVVLSKTEAITNGAFSSKIKIEKTMEAGDYLITINAYEKDSQDRVLNKGVTTQAITINQIPTSLEIVFEKKEVAPGETLRTKAILHDQTGKKISSLVVITIKTQEDSIIEQVEKQTDNFVEYPIKEREAPTRWKVIAASSQLSKEDSFEIIAQEKINTEIINKTLILTNTGNVPYNRTVLVEIGDQTLNVDAVLKVGESKKYYLTAPNGEYQVSVLSPQGQGLSKSVVLTGDAISIKEVSEGTIDLIRHPFVWIFITIVLGFVAFLFFKKEYKKTFFGYFSPKKYSSAPVQERAPVQKNVLVSPKNKAHLSMAIQGTQQKASAVCLKIKNYQDILSNKNGVSETIQKVVNMAESVKASVYENNESIIFLFIPQMTKTFQSEVTSADFAQSARKILEDHNKLFKQKINYGLSAEYGEVIAKQVGDSISFMGLGTFLINLKKLASLSQGEVFVGEKLKERIQSDAKLEKRNSERMPYYIIKEIRDKEKSQKFINSFMKRQGGSVPSKVGQNKDIGKKEPEKTKSDEPKKDNADEDFDLDSL